MENDGNNVMSNLPDISTATASSDANTLPAATTPLPPLNGDNTNNPNYRPTLNGAWVLDRNRGSPSAKGFLQTMSLSDHAIEANEKGDQEHDTIHDITLTSQHFSITKTSRVNDLTLNVTLGQEHLETMDRIEDKYSKDSAAAKIDRWKKTMATSEHLGHVRVETSMPTINGMARVLDVKTLVQETVPINTISNQSSLDQLSPQQQQQQETQSIYIQHLTIWNETTGNKCDTTIRHFRPYHGHTRPTALTAGGKKRKQDFETIPTGNNGLEYDVVVAAAAAAATSSPDTGHGDRTHGKGKRKHASR